MRTTPTLVGVTAVAVALAAAGVAACSDSGFAATPSPAPGPAAPAAGVPDFAAITERAGPSVVNVRVSGMRQMTADGSDDDASQALLDLLRRRYGGAAPRIQVPVRGEGSGFIVSSDGVVLTNAHVVDGAKQVTVRLIDRREFDARVLGVDRKTDIAVLKIDAKDLQAVQLGDPAQLRPGHWVLAIGSPYGLENTVTAGIVSALGRTLPDDSAVRFIQTDVPINPGNSGGPLFNTRGEVVGINSQIYSQSGGYQGLSFAIPIDVALHVEKEILTTGHVSHARLGVTVQDVDATLASSFRLPKPEGALIASVQPGSAAARAGLEAGDVVLRIDGKPIITSGDLSTTVLMHTAGDKVQLDVWHAGAERRLEVALADASDRPAEVATEEQTPAQALGLRLRPLQPDERQAMGTRGGLFVEDVSGSAALAGMQPGDVVLGINGKPVDSVAALRSALAHAGRSVALLVQRGQDRIYIPIARG